MFIKKTDSSFAVIVNVIDGDVCRETQYIHQYMQNVDGNNTRMSNLQRCLLSEASFSAYSRSVLGTDPVLFGFLSCADLSIGETRSLVSIFLVSMILLLSRWLRFFLSSLSSLSESRSVRSVSGEVQKNGVRIRVSRAC